MGLEKVIGKLTPLLLAGSLAVSNCGKDEECANDNQCPGGEICSNGQCLAQAGTCNDDYGCEEGQICENYSCVNLTSSLPGVPATTKILDEKAADYLLSVSSDKGTIRFSSASGFAKSLKTGDVIVSGIYNLTPEGLLRRVTAKSDNGQSITLSTASANLEQAIEDGNLSAKIVLTPAYLEMASPLREGVGLGVKEAPLSADFSNSQSLTINFENTDLYQGKVFLDGELVLSSEMSLELEISSSQVKHVKFTIEGSENLELKLYGEFSESINKKLPPFKPVKFAPIMFMAGWVPVVIVPDLNITLGMTANGSLSVETSITQSKSATYGIEYQNQQWSSFKSFEDSFDFNPPTFSNTQAYAKAYANSEIEFNLYGMAGPVAGAEVYVEANITPLTNLWYVLSAGAKVYAGIEVGEIGSKSLIDYETVLFEKKVTLDEGYKEGCQSECDFKDQKECIDETGWKECGDYDNNGCLEWSEKFLCNLDGTSKQYCEEGECLAKSCAENKWQCADGTCIPIAWHCNKKEECPGGLGEDEEGCGCLGTNDCVYTGAKGCFDEGWKECGDFNGDNCLEWGNYHPCGTDEECSWGECVKKEVCSFNNFYCESGNWGGANCIPSSEVCDGYKDCKGGEDEEGCSTFCSSNEWECNDGKCIPSYSLCDGGNDCDNGEDEVNCCEFKEKYMGCFNDNLWWYSGCGKFLGDVAQICSDGCENNQCINCDPLKSYTDCFGGDVWWYNSCGNPFEVKEWCMADETCDGDDCFKECELSGYGDCFKGDVVWYNDCGEKTGIDACQYGCKNGQCLTCANPKFDAYCSGGDVWFDKGCGEPFILNECAGGCEEVSGTPQCLGCTTDNDCGLNHLCKKDTGECLPQPSPLCTGVNCTAVGIKVYDNGGLKDDSFGLEIVGNFYGETDYGGSKTWSIPMIKNQTYDMVLHGVGIPDDIGTYKIELTNATKVEGPALSGDDLDGGNKKTWKIKAD